jgi:hypothetical protein
MKALIPTIVTFDKPYFVYELSTMKVTHAPEDVQAGSEAATAVNFTTQKPIEADTIEDLMVKFDELGLKMDEPDSWDFEEKKVQLFMTYEQNASLMQSDYGLDLLGYFKSLNPLPITVNKIQGIYIYLSEIYPQHRGLLESFGIRVIDKN